MRQRAVGLGALINARVHGNAITFGDLLVRPPNGERNITVCDLVAPPNDAIAKLIILPLEMVVDMDQVVIIIWIQTKRVRVV